MKITIEELRLKVKDLPKERREFFFSELTGVYKFHEKNISNLKEKVKEAQEEKRKAVSEFGKGSIFTKIVDEKLRQLKKEYNETIIGVDFFKREILKRLEKDFV